MIYTPEIQKEILPLLDKHFIFTEFLLKDKITGEIHRNNETIEDYLIKIKKYRTNMKTNIEIFIDETSIIQELNKTTILEENIIEEQSVQKPVEKPVVVKKPVEKPVKTQNKSGGKGIDPSDFVGKLIDTIIDIIFILIKITNLGFKMTQFMLILIPIFLIIFVVISIDNDLEYL